MPEELCTAIKRSDHRKDENEDKLQVVVHLGIGGVSFAPITPVRAVVTTCGQVTDPAGDSLNASADLIFGSITATCSTNATFRVGYAPPGYDQANAPYPAGTLQSAKRRWFRPKGFWGPFLTLDALGHKPVLASGGAVTAGERPGPSCQEGP